MTKKEFIERKQAQENELIYALLSTVVDELKSVDFVERLRTCSARVYQTKSGLWLKSYNTFIAYLDFNTGICVDFLRGVWDCTNTSAQHFAKFCHDYSAQKIYRYDYSEYTPKNIQQGLRDIFVKIQFHSIILCGGISSI